jgi:hypothetical protein
MLTVRAGLADRYGNHTGPDWLSVADSNPISELGGRNYPAGLVRLALSTYCGADALKPVLGQAQAAIGTLVTSAQT